MIFRCLFLAICIPFAASSQQVSITGTATDLTGKIIELIRYTDPISKNEILLSRDSVDASGEFSLKTELSETSQIWIRVNRFAAPLIAKPNAKYQIEIPHSAKTALLNQWRPGELEYIFVGLKKDDINTKLLDFDNAYFSFFKENARLLGTMKIKPKVLEFQTVYSDIDSSFYKDYINYSIAEMKLISDFPKKEIYEVYLENSDLPMNNPAFFSFFVSFYTDSFEGLDAQRKQSSEKDSDSKALTFSALENTMALSNDFLAKSEIRHWVLLIKIKEELYSNTANADHLLGILLDLEKSSTAERVKEACREVRVEFENYSTPDIQNIFPAIAEQIESEKPALLIVSYPKSMERLRENGVVESLLNEYGDYFQVVEILLGNDFKRDASTIGRLEEPERRSQNHVARHKDECGHKPLLEAVTYKLHFANRLCPCFHKTTHSK